MNRITIIQSISISNNTIQEKGIEVIEDEIQ